MAYARVYYPYSCPVSSVWAGLEAIDLARPGPRAVLAYVTCVLRAQFKNNYSTSSCSAAEGATLLEIQTARSTFIAAAKSTVVEEVLSDNDRRL